MKTAQISVKSVPGSELFYSKPKLDEKKRNNETHDQFEERSWQDRIHHDGGKLFLPPFALKNALEMSAKWLSMPIAGEGKKTYSKRFASGVLVTDRLWLKNGGGRQLKLEDIEPRRLFVPSDGVRGSGKRVMRIFPAVKEWQADATIYVLDDKITENVLFEHLTAMGNFIGMGAMRVGNGGINGRMTVEALALA